MGAREKRRKPPFYRVVRRLYEGWICEGCRNGRRLRASPQGTAPMPAVAVHADITPRLLASLRYDRQVVQGDDGTLKTRKTPKRVAYWYIGDTKQPGLSVRVRPGGVTYYLRARNGRKQLDRLLGQYPHDDDTRRPCARPGMDGAHTGRQRPDRNTGATCGGAQTAARPQNTDLWPSV